MTKGYHEPVLLVEAVDGLDVKPDGLYIDATYGGGGHSEEILKRLMKGKLFAFDQDADAVARTADDRFRLIRDNFRNMQSYVDANAADGILADLGVSSHQFDIAERGFSTRFDAPLDMRMDQRSSTTAADILNKYSEEELVQVFSKYGEVRNSKQLAKAVVSFRRETAIQTTADLKQAIRNCIPAGKENQYLAQVFQALRIQVNQEMESLEEFLNQSALLLKSGGRLVVISYHSLEDRLVKNMMMSGNTSGNIEKDLYGNVINKPFKVITKKPVAPGEEEIRRNARSRSARMRIAEKI
jgi:16S rRNA (cytosine1402-N4)-methyltransferase